MEEGGEEGGKEGGRKGREKKQLYATNVMNYSYRIAQKFRGSKFSRIAVFENYEQLKCSAYNTTTPNLSTHPHHSVTTLTLFTRSSSLRSSNLTLVCAHDGTALDCGLPAHLPPLLFPATGLVLLDIGALFLLWCSCIMA